MGIEVGIKETNVQELTNYLLYSTTQFFLFWGQQTRQTNKNSPRVTVLTGGIQKYGEKKRNFAESKNI